MTSYAPVSTDDNFGRRYVRALRLAFRAACCESTSEGRPRSGILGYRGQGAPIRPRAIWRHAPKQESAVWVQRLPSELPGGRLLNDDACIDDQNTITERVEVFDTVCYQHQSERV